MTKFTKESGNPFALIPLFVFIFVLGAGIILNDFYFPSPVAVLIGIIAAFYCINHLQNEKKLILIAGCGDSKIITMCFIY
jgi:Na+/H+ antiporter NhaC